MSVILTAHMPPIECVSDEDGMRIAQERFGRDYHVTWADANDTSKGVRVSPKEGGPRGIPRDFVPAHCRPAIEVLPSINCVTPEDGLRQAREMFGDHYDVAMSATNTRITATPKAPGIRARWPEASRPACVKYLVSFDDAPDPEPLDSVSDMPMEEFARRGGKCIIDMQLEAA